MLDDYSVGSIVIFSIVVVGFLLLDLYAHRDDKPPTLKNALLWCIFWEALSQSFGIYVLMTHGGRDYSLFLAGYFLEKSLSVDNLFVIMAIFAAFSIKDAFQRRVLYYGIVGALVLRLVFVAAGSTLLMAFGDYALTAFGIFVLWSAWKMWKSMNADTHEVTDYAHHWSVRMTQRFIPVHPALEGHSFFTKINGRWFATPLLLCLVCIEFADVLFAFDSVPAIIAITEKPFLVYTSNIFAILGLRSLYFLLAAARRFLCHLEKAVIGILAYIGIKMLLDVAGVIHISPYISLFIVLGLLSLGIAASFIWPDKGKCGA